MPKTNHSSGHYFPSWLALNAFQEKLGYEFKNIAQLELALTHTSWANERNMAGANNQRLEFLGDAVLELCVSEELFCRFSDAREGALTEARSGLVNETELAGIARNLGLDKLIRLGKGEEKQDGRNKDSLLADAFEALLAAVYLDGGFEAARALVGRVYTGRWPQSAGRQKEKDPKTMLQEECQKLFRNVPVYTLVAASGPEHARTFVVRLSLPDGREFTGTESSAKKAEQLAAAQALSALKKA